MQIRERENRLLFTDKEGTAVYKTAMVPDYTMTDRLPAAGVSTTGEEIQQTAPPAGLLPRLGVAHCDFCGHRTVISRRMMKNAGGANAMMFGKSNAKVYVKSAEGIKFSDVAGEENRDNLKKIMKYLYGPKKYRGIGASMPKDILLVGLPGTDKTMLAKAVASEANVPFFSVSGLEFVEMSVDMGSSKVRDLLKQAKEKALCIVFIDEIDTIGICGFGGFSLSAIQVAPCIRAVATTAWWISAATMPACRRRTAPPCWSS